MKKFLNALVVVFSLALVLACGETAFAKTTTVSKTEEATYSLYSVGDSITVTGASVKINNKSLKKMKKKVKNILTSKNDYGYYIPASYYEYDYYTDYNDYYEAQNKCKYKPRYSYELVFLKAGTYTIKYVTYDYDTEWVAVEGTEYESRDVTIYKTTHVKKIKVVKGSTSPIKSVKLGNAKYETTYTSSEKGGTTEKTVVKRYLSGKKGKLKVKANSNYSVTSIVVVTYDAESNKVYTQVKNNKNVTFGAYCRSYINKNNDKYISKSTYKPTFVYIGYKNKFTGAYSTYTVKTDEDGDQYVEYTEASSKNGEVYTGRGTNADYDVRYTFYKK